MTNQKVRQYISVQGGLLTSKIKAYEDAMNAIKANPTVDVENSYVPLQHQYKKDCGLMNIQSFCKIANGVQQLTTV